MSGMHAAASPAAPAQSEYRPLRASLIMHT
jgi:hypothetical protein